MPLPPGKPTSSWAALGKVTAAAQGGVSLPTLSREKDTPGERCSGPLKYKRRGHTGESEEGPQR